VAQGISPAEEVQSIGNVILCRDPGNGKVWCTLCLLIQLVAAELRQGNDVEASHALFPAKIEFSK